MSSAVIQPCTARRHVRLKEKDSRRPTASNEHLAQLDTLLCVHVEQLDGCAPFCREPEDLKPSQFEVSDPWMLSRVVERSNTPTSRVDGCDVGSLLQVAVDAAEAEILEIVRPVVLSTDDMVDLMG